MEAVNEDLLAPEPVNDAGVPTDTITALLLAAAERQPDTPALIFPDVQVSYAELRERVHERARQLLGLGLERGEALGLLMPNCPELVEFLFAAAMLGVITIPINVRFKTRELSHVLANGMHALVTTDAMDEHLDLAGLVAEVLPELPAADPGSALTLAAAPELRRVVLTGSRQAPGFATEAMLRAGAVPETAELYRAEGADPVLVMYTSGTTALPKGCVLPHRSLTHNARAVAVKFGLGEPGEVFWDPMPMFHMASLLPLNACFAAGASFASLSHFDPDVSIRMLDELRPAVVYSCFPPVTMGIMHHPGFQALRPLGARAVMNVAPPDTQRLIAEAFAPARLVGAYGCTEGTGTLSYHAMEDDDDHRINTCGVPMTGTEVLIFDPVKSQEVPVGERGEIVIRGRNRFVGYYRDEPHTREAIDERGFFHTGDIGSKDADGHVYYHGRLKDMLKVGGENVASLEVEDLIATHPAVKLVVVTGAPDLRLVEVPAAFVEIAPGATLTEQEVIDFCRGQIASFKVPRYVRFVTEWPMSATKIQKYKLREELEAELATASTTP
jgi:fatty-acyl-CoA synthase